MGKKEINVRGGKNIWLVLSVGKFVIWSVKKGGLVLSVGKYICDGW